LTNATCFKGNNLNRQTNMSAPRRLAQISAQLQASMQPQLSALATHSTGGASSTPAGPSGKKAVRVVVTGAAGNIAYSILFMIGQGAMLGPDQPVELRLLDLPQMMDAVKGVEMELTDCALPLVSAIVATDDPKVAFDKCDIALLIGAKPRGPGMQRKDLLTSNAAIFAAQGKAINQYANKTVKVLVVGNPANTNAMITQINAPDIPKENFTAMTRLDQHRGVAQIANRLKVPVRNVRNVIIWGNHSKTQYPDVNHAYVTDFPKSGHTTTVRESVKDDKWLNTEFLETVQDRGAAIIAKRKLSSAASAAYAAVAHVRSWVLGTPKGEFVSMGVISDGSYGVPKGICFSYPVICSGGKWQIVQNLKLDAFSQDKIKITTEELLDEKKQALSIPAPAAAPAAAAKPAAK